ncbi:MAG TPA: ATP-binding protein [Solirubrobacteraceae bacterium]|nr:ATP-binding protein [Solirubrobacteraceae bacterium]
MSRFSLRLRLALLIGLMLLVCGGALLAISYGLVSSNLNAPLEGALPSEPSAIGNRIRVGRLSSTRAAKEIAAPKRAAQSTPKSASETPSGASQARAKEAVAKAAQTALTNRTLGQLVTQYLAVLAGIVLVAVALGWLLAGRLLRSVRRITSVAGRVTGRNLSERIGLGGPRDELRELADAFDGMLARLDGVFRAQRRFVADASHELRTPLAAMRAEVEVLAADPHATATDVEAATLVLQRQLARSEELIEALLALARSEPELLMLEVVDLAQLACEAFEDAGARMADCRLRIDHQLAPAVVHGDRRLLTLLVSNLLDNAIKHNHDGGWISLRGTVDADSALLAVANSGQVVAAEEVQELAQAFRRGGRARVGDGHGLGLAIVAAVTHAHQGELTIMALEEGGLRVEISLPLAVDDVLDAPAASSTNGAMALGAGK